MAVTKKKWADISNTAIRIFLQKVGEHYDRVRGLRLFVPTKEQWDEVISFFEGRCCYCGRDCGSDRLSKDHLVPMNKKFLGLHAWGNVVPCCGACNDEKHHVDWRAYLQTKEQTDELLARVAKVESFVDRYQYRPELAQQLVVVAGHLYEDVGAVATALVELRIKQAQEVINKIQGGRR